MADNQYNRHNPRLTTGDIAGYCQVSKGTVLAWINGGRLKAFRLPSGHYRIDKEDFREFLRAWRMPIREWLFSPESAGKTG